MSVDNFVDCIKFNSILSIYLISNSYILLLNAYFIFTLSVYNLYSPRFGVINLNVQACKLP